MEVELTLLIYHLVVICDHDPREIQLVLPLAPDKPVQFLNECVHWVDEINAVLVLIPHSDII